MSTDSNRRFEFDFIKSEVNRRKHGVDFITAQALWLDESGLELPSAFPVEARWLRIGRFDGRHWTAIFTLRNDVVRLMSVRRARHEEISIYENE